MTCPACGAAMHVATGKDYLVCDYCGTTHFPDPNPDGVRVLGEATVSPCPRCKPTLVTGTIAGAHILYCNQCHGLLISMGDFMAVVEELRSRHTQSEYAGQQPDWSDLDRHTNCPKCGRQMDTHPYCGPGNVIIDTCENCSVNWLDYGELQRIVRAPDAHYEIPMDEEERDKIVLNAELNDHS
jgi:Zn-finger nucleic acid-binding protein